MKKQMNFSNAIRKTILASFLAISLVPSMVGAQEKQANLPGVAIKYIGTMDSQPVFQIEFDNKTEEAFNISIKDDQGNLLYTEKFRDKKFSKKFKYEGSGFENVKLSFTLTGDKDKQTQVFEVNTNTRLVQDVVVTRL